MTLPYRTELPFILFALSGGARVPGRASVLCGRSGGWPTRVAVLYVNTHVLTLIMRKTKSAFLQIRITPADRSSLQRHAKRAGKDVSTYVLDLVLPGSSAALERQVARLRAAGDSFALAELHDFLATLTPQEFARAVDQSPLRLSDDPLMANYVAAMIEHVAGDFEIAPPTWTRDVVPLAVPWFVTPLKSLRLHLLFNAPPAFRRRNIFVDTSVGARV